VGIPRDIVCIDLVLDLMGQPTLQPEFAVILAIAMVMCL